MHLSVETIPNYLCCNAAGAHLRQMVNGNAQAGWFSEMGHLGWRANNEG